SCIGFCLSIERPASEASIFNAGRLKILDCTYTNICIDCMKDTLVYALQQDPKMHGSFGKREQNSEAFLNMSREKNINGFMPYYLGEEHYYIANRAMKPLLGWMA